MKSNLLTLSILSLFLVFQSCSKDDPIPEIDQEEVSGATLFFTEVDAESHGDHYHYHDIEGAQVDSLVFSGTEFLPDPGAHLHLEVGKSYRFSLTVRDFAGRESQQTFIDRDDQHFAFLADVPEGSLTAEYADLRSDQEKVKVGITGYINVVELSETFVLRYVMRHLNPGVKETIDPKVDIFNNDFTKFEGATDLDLKFEVHLVEEEHHHDH
ncbi:MAG: hypothetical protein ACTHZ1_04050 [Sphingobacterium sp.]